MRGLFVVALALSVTAACSDPRSSNTSESRSATVPATSASIDGGGSTRVDLTAVATRPDPGVVAVTGTATVPDGAHVNWVLTPASTPTTCPVDVAPEDDPCNVPYGTATVADQRFQFRVDGVAPGEAELFVGFDPLSAPQPESVAARYGARGQRMTGAQVIDYGDGLFRAQLIQTVIVE